MHVFNWLSILLCLVRFSRPFHGNRNVIQTHKHSKFRVIRYSLQCQQTRFDESTISRIYLTSFISSLSTSALRLSKSRSILTASALIEPLQFSAFLYLLHSASLRKRLDGNTFKLLNLGILITSVVCLPISCWSFFGESLPFPFFRILTSVTSFAASALVINQYTLPTAKFDIGISLSLGYLVLLNIKSNLELKVYFRLLCLAHLHVIIG